MIDEYQYDLSLAGQTTRFTLENVENHRPAIQYLSTAKAKTVRIEVSSDASNLNNPVFRNIMQGISYNPEIEHVEIHVEDTVKISASQESIQPISSMITHHQNLKHLMLYTGETTEFENKNVCITLWKSIAGNPHLKYINIWISNFCKYLNEYVSSDEAQIPLPFENIIWDCAKDNMSSLEQFLKYIISNSQNLKNLVLNYGDKFSKTPLRNLIENKSPLNTLKKNLNKHEHIQHIIFAADKSIEHITQEDITKQWGPDVLASLLYYAPDFIEWTRNYLARNQLLRQSPPFRHLTLKTFAEHDPALALPYNKLTKEEEKLEKITQEDIDCHKLDEATLKFIETYGNIKYELLSQKLNKLQENKQTENFEEREKLNTHMYYAKQNALRAEKTIAQRQPQAFSSLFPAASQGITTATDTPHPNGLQNH